MKSSSTASIKISPYEVGSLILDMPPDALATVKALTGSGGLASNYTVRGYSRLPNLPVGSYAIDANGPGYERVPQMISLSKGEEKSFKPWTGGTLVVETEPPDPAGPIPRLRDAERGTRGL